MKIQDEQIRRQIYECINCNSCTGRYPEEVCPFRLVHRGTVHGMRGFLHVLKRVIEGDIPLSNSLAEYAYSDTFCGSCKERCVHRLDIAAIGRAFRTDLVEAKLGPRPEHLAMIQAMKNYDNPWGLPRKRRSAWAKGLDIPELWKTPQRKAQVLYYVGCTASSDPMATRMAKATVSILSKAGVDFTILGKEEKCCASTTHWMGDYPTFEEWAGMNRETLNEVNAEAIITSCAGCYLMLKRRYPETIGALNKPILHTTEYLVKLLAEGKITFKTDTNVKATYHDPCHLGRHGELFDAPRTLLESLPNVTFAEMPRSKQYSWCCGAGGGVRTGYQENALAIATERIKEAEATGADTLVSACPFCYQNLSIALQHNHSSLQFRDVTELADQAM